MCVSVYVEPFSDFPRLPNRFHCCAMVHSTIFTCMHTHTYTSMPILWQNAGPLLVFFRILCSFALLLFHEIPNFYSHRFIWKPLRCASFKSCQQTNTYTCTQICVCVCVFHSPAELSFTCFLCEYFMFAFVRTPKISIFVGVSNVSIFIHTNTHTHVYIHILQVLYMSVCCAAFACFNLFLLHNSFPFVKHPCCLCVYRNSVLCQFDGGSNL